MTIVLFESDTEDRKSTVIDDLIVVIEQILYRLKRAQACWS
ncbi:MAG: hypothetical protein NVS4B2_30790 [Chloroflexota bacterium]